MHSICHGITLLVCVYTDRLGKREKQHYSPPTHPAKKPPGSIIREREQINYYDILVVGYNFVQNMDKPNDWPRSGDSDIPPVTHARDLRSAPVAPLIPYVSICMLDSV